jgi:hypothetical protein
LLDTVTEHDASEPVHGPPQLTKRELAFGAASSSTTAPSLTVSLHRGDDAAAGTRRVDGDRERLRSAGLRVAVGVTVIVGATRHVVRAGIAADRAAHGAALELRIVTSSHDDEQQGSDKRAHQK